MNEIARHFSSVTVTAGSTAGTTTQRFAYGMFAGGVVLIANTNGATQLRWYGASGSSDTPVQVYADGSAVTTSVTVGAHPVPDACYGLAYVAPIIVGATTMPMTVSLKG
jgi:hypothetical protein